MLFLENVAMAPLSSFSEAANLLLILSVLIQCLQTNKKSNLMLYLERELSHQTG